MVKEGFKELSESDLPLRTPLLKGTKSAPNHNIKNHNQRITKQNSKPNCKATQLALRLPRFINEAESSTTPRGSFRGHGFHRLTKSIETLWTPRTDSDGKKAKIGNIS